MQFSPARDLGKQSHGVRAGKGLGKTSHEVRVKESNLTTLTYANFFIFLICRPSRG